MSTTMVMCPSLSAVSGTASSGSMHGKVASPWREVCIASTPRKKWAISGDCSRVTGVIQPVHDAVMQGFVDGLQLGLHATGPAQDVY